jgi:hypothetical protein
VVLFCKFERMCVLIYLFVETGHAVAQKLSRTFSNFCWPIVQAAHEVQRAYCKKPEHAIDAWFTFLASFGFRGCGNDRDRVYALLGLSPPQSRIPLEIDYAKRRAEIYTEVATFALRSGVLQHLYSAGAWRRKEPKTHGATCSPDYLQSWVPDHSSSPVDARAA